MSVDLIRYDLLAQEALRGVVRRVLEDVARTGVPGDHHFYISFITAFPGVRVSSRLREKYPEEMTIILQHQFWDLNVGEHAFEVGLSFGGVPEMLYVPFDAISGFFDPSVKFGLKFEPIAAEGAAEATPPEAAAASVPHLREVVPGAGSEPGETDAPAPAPAAPTDEQVENAPEGGAEILSLDKFRRK